MESELWETINALVEQVQELEARVKELEEK